MPLIDIKKGAGSQILSIVRQGEVAKMRLLFFFMYVVPLSACNISRCEGLMLIEFSIGCSAKICRHIEDLLEVGQHYRLLLVQM
jgi:hypothetical protein